MQPTTISSTEHLTLSVSPLYDSTVSFSLSTQSKTTADNSFSRDEIAIMVARLTPHPHPQDSILSSISRFQSLRYNPEFI